MHVLEVTASGFSSAGITGPGTTGRYPNYVWVIQEHATVSSGWWGPINSYIEWPSYLLKRIKSDILDKDMHIDSIEIWFGHPEYDHNFTCDLEFVYTETTKSNVVQNTFDLPHTSNTDGKYTNLSNNVCNFIKSVAGGNGTLQTNIYPIPSRAQSPYGDEEGFYQSVEAPRIRILYREKYSTVTADKSTINFGDTIQISLSVLDPAYNHTVQVSLGDFTTSQTLAPGVTTLTIAIPLNWMEYVPNSDSYDTLVTCVTFDANSKRVGADNIYITTNVPENIVPVAGQLQWTANNGLNLPLSNRPLVVSLTGQTGVYGSTINYTITADGYQSYNQALTIENVPLIHSDMSEFRTITATATVTDSRGRISTTTLDIDIYEWAFPFILSMEIYRSNSAGEKSNDGHYARVEGTYDSYPVTVNGTRRNSVQSCNMKIVSRASGTEIDAGNLVSGRAKVIGDGQLLSDDEYAVRFAVTDNVATIVFEYVIYSNMFIMHFKHGGTGVAFGQAATDDDTVQISPLWKLLIGNNVDVAAKLADLESRIEALEGN